ncbi:uncharacterized protein mRpL30 [Planococcus citri]|uniref:uncharacterized protein mRpL30 n=1 Tax=Planococcus citri TaxID=170843 RepID=UPI0031F91FAC
MNILRSKLPPASALIRGALGNLQADYNNVIIRTGCSRIITKRMPPHKRWPGYRYRFKNGIEYYGFTYYPNSPNEIEPEWQPTELFMVRRVKPYYGNPFWEKRILKYFHLDGKQTDISIVMNDQETNKKLWQVKHLVEITPITFPDGYPEDGDISKCRLYENGEMRIDKSNEPAKECIEATEHLHKQPELPTKRILEVHARKRWEYPFSNNTHI